MYETRCTAIIDRYSGWLKVAVAGLPHPGGPSARVPAPCDMMPNVGPRQAAGWRMLASRGLADLSPPEAEHTMLELPTNRIQYIGVLQELADYPSRSPIGHRAPTEAEVAALARAAGSWGAVVLLDDERALRSAAGLFRCVFVLDPFYDSGALLYAAWHDPLLSDEHSRHLAEHAGLLVRVGSLLSAGTAVLTPDHLPGSWNPRPGWRKPRASADRRQLAAWAMRTSLVLLYWADRLNAVVCTARSDIIAALDVALGQRATSSSLVLAEPASIDDAQVAREAHFGDLGQGWALVQRISRRRARRRLDDVSHAIGMLNETLRQPTEPHSWRLMLGQTSLADPSLLIRRVLNGEDPQREPRLPLKRIKRRPLCLVPVHV